MKTEDTQASAPVEPSEKTYILEDTSRTQVKQVRGRPQMMLQEKQI